MKQNLSLNNLLNSYIDTSLYNNDQLEQLERGIKQGLDIYAYTNPTFNWRQMKEIRKGLKDGLNVSYYTKPDIDWYTMQDLRKTQALLFTTKKMYETKPNIPTSSRLTTQ